MHTGWQDIPAECSQKVPEEEAINLSLSLSLVCWWWEGRYIKRRGMGTLPGVKVRMPRAAAHINKRWLIAEWMSR